MIKNNRVDHIDIAKGITIILVALFHSNLRNNAPDVIDSMGLFRLPLFFFLSGLFFNASSKIDFFIFNKTDALLKPYFFTSFALLVVSALANWGPFQGHLMYQLLGILYGNGDTIVWVPMWFLTHLFVLYCFAYFMFRITDIQKRHLIVKYIFIAAMLAIGSHWIDTFSTVEITLFGKNIELHGLPLSFDLVFISAAFFISGALLKEWIINFTPNSYVFFISVLIFIAVVVLTDAKIDLNRRIYINPLFATIGAVCGIYFSIFMSFYFGKIKLLRTVLLVFGRASLFILIFHIFIGNTVYRALLEFGMDGPSNIMISLVAFISSITLPILIKAMVSRSEALSFFYFPLKSGNSLHRSQK